MSRASITAAVKESVMHTREQFYTETLEHLKGYPGAQRYAELCCKLPNFYFYAARQELAYEVLLELVHKFRVDRKQSISAPELMWRIAREWNKVTYHEKLRKSFDTYMNNVARELLISVTDLQKEQPH